MSLLRILSNMHCEFVSSEAYLLGITHNCNLFIWMLHDETEMMLIYPPWIEENLIIIMKKDMGRLLHG